MHVIAVLNQKGGAGKTTIATHLARALQIGGADALLIDSDPGQRPRLGGRAGGSTGFRGRAGQANDRTRSKEHRAHRFGRDRRSAASGRPRRICDQGRELHPDPGAAFVL